MSTPNIFRDASYEAVQPQFIGPITFRTDVFDEVRDRLQSSDPTQIIQNLRENDSVHTIRNQDGGYTITIGSSPISNQELGWEWLKTLGNAGMSALCYAGALAWKSRILAAGSLVFFGLGIWYLGKATYHTVYKALTFLSNLCRS